MYKASREPSAILALKKTLEDLLPDLLSKPSDEGILGFYTFESVLEEEDAVKAVTAVKAINPTMPTLDTALVIDLHAALRRTGLGGRLPYQSFVSFLRWGQDRAAAGWAPDKLDSVVKGIIHDIEISNEVQSITTTRTASKLMDGPTNLVPVLSGIRLCLDEIVKYFDAQAKELREQHGGINNHASIDDVMIKIGNCVDRTTLKVLMEEVFAIHAEQLATANSNGVKYVRKIMDLIDKALAISS
ncbi:hypothetical protein G7Y89_g13775 [Cudoniella acicularis]|uniref:Uncharacterized protein n=1 Tax=Cudoniella acicularis TaxID=354080 RepID=A0A8H4R960_9HELO|nr:hypothetical protein G7Y89_g13775 [Cudoniella acicularis]